MASAAARAAVGLVSPQSYYHSTSPHAARSTWPPWPSRPASPTSPPSSSLEATLNDIMESKLKRYSLFESRLNGGAQSAGAWYQETAEPAYTCVHEERIGPHGDGGKWVCDPEKIRSSSSCLIYSIGSSNDFRFEEAILRDISNNCEIHVFDHTVKNATNKPLNVHFHPWGLAVRTHGALKSLTNIVHQLNHTGRTIDVFKIDCEGCEWDTQ